jgi:hypothetical protein
MNNDSIKGYELITDSMIIHPSLSELAGWTFEKNTVVKFIGGQ